MTCYSERARCPLLPRGVIYTVRLPESGLLETADLVFISTRCKAKGRSLLRICNSLGSRTNRGHGTGHSLPLSHPQFPRQSPPLPSRPSLLRRESPTLSSNSRPTPRLPPKWSPSVSLPTHCSSSQPPVFCLSSIDAQHSKVIIKRSPDGATLAACGVNGGLGTYVRYFDRRPGVGSYTLRYVQHALFCHRHTNPHLPSRQFLMLVFLPSIFALRLASR
jgi:hypothetical protein